MSAQNESQRLALNSSNSIYSTFANQLAIISNESCANANLNSALILCDSDLICNAFSFVLKKISANVSIEVDSLALSPSQETDYVYDITIIVCQSPTELNEISLFLENSSFSNIIIIAPQSLPILSFKEKKLASTISLESGANVIRNALIRTLNNEIFSEGFVENQAAKKISGLTHRQKEVLQCICDGKVNKEIARDLNLSLSTVKVHCMAIFKELEVNNRSQATALALQA